jgi:hypothetical protein
MKACINCDIGPFITIPPFRYNIKIHGIRSLAEFFLGGLKGKTNQSWSLSIDLRSGMHCQLTSMAPIDDFSSFVHLLNVLAQYLHYYKYYAVWLIGKDHDPDIERHRGVWFDWYPVGFLICSPFAFWAPKRDQHRRSILNKVMANHTCISGGGRGEPHPHPLSSKSLPSNIFGKLCRFKNAIKNDFYHMHL